MFNRSVALDDKDMKQTDLNLDLTNRSATHRLFARHRRTVLPEEFLRSIREKLRDFDRRPLQRSQYVRGCFSEEQPHCGTHQ